VRFWAIPDRPVAPTIRTTLLALALLMAGCDWNAPHDNPRDPYHGGNIEGRLMNRRATGIRGVRVSARDIGQRTETDSIGRFGLYGLPVESLVIRFEADSFAPDSVRIGLVMGRIDTLTRFLDGLPYLLGCSLTTHVYYRSWPEEPLTSARFQARARDIDGEADVDSAWIEIPGRHLSRRLIYDPDQQRFGLTIWMSARPDSSLEALVGQEVRFRVADRQGIATESRRSLTRIIYDPPVPLFPASGQDSLSGETTFFWRRFNAGFWVRYRGEIVRIEGGGPLGVAAGFDTAGWSDTTCQFNVAALAPGEYYWTLEAIDTLGNSSRSAEKRFRVY
jgi:hypothetical protein